MPITPPIPHCILPVVYRALLHHGNVTMLVLLVALRFNICPAAETLSPYSAQCLLCIVWYCWTHEVFNCFLFGAGQVQ